MIQSSAKFERISNRYKAAVAKSKPLLEETFNDRNPNRFSESRKQPSISRRISIRVGRTSKEDRLKLRLYLAQRIRRSDGKVRRNCSPSPRCDWEEKDFFSNTFNKSPHTDTRMPLSNKRQKPSLSKHAGMQEFIVFEPSLP
jgi:hypothetical protein